MCVLCKQSIMANDLQTIEGIQTCKATRWCLIQLLRDATPEQIASLHASALQKALHATTTVLELPA